MLNNIFKNVKIILGIVAGILLLATIFLWLRNNSLKEDNNRLSNNQVALTKDVEYYKTKSGKDAAKVMELTLKKDEFEKMCVDQTGIIKDLKIKLKRVESMSSTGTETHTGGHAPLVDTVIVVKKDTVYAKEKAKYFIWEDNWNKISGIIVGDDVDCVYRGIDTLDIVAHRVPKKFLFFRFGTKYIEVTTANRNPSTRITYSKAIKITK